MSFVRAHFTSSFLLLTSYFLWRSGGRRGDRNSDRGARASGVLAMASGHRELSLPGIADHSVSVNLHSMSSVVKIDPEIMSGAPCFAGTRVPIQNLIDYLEGGDSIEDFLEGFPSVSREQVIAFLEEAKECMLAAAAK